MEPLTKGRWVIEFVDQLTELRPDMGVRLANAIGLSEWGRNKGEAPLAAARRWFEAHRPAAPASTPRPRKPKA